MAEHRVAVVVFCTVDAATPTDAKFFAEHAVRQAMREPGFTHSRRTIHFRPRPDIDLVPVEVHKVLELGAANYGGYLGLEPTGRAYPREEHPDV